MFLNLMELSPAIFPVKCLKRIMPMRKKFVVLLIAMFLLNSALFAQQSTVTGKVTDENAIPLIGATVAISGSNTAVATDANGNFSIDVARGQTLEISYVGKSDQKVVVGKNPVINVTGKSDQKVVVGKNPVINVTLKNQTESSLEEVVVTGYMSQKKADLTGAVAVVSPKELSKGHGVTNVMQSLQGVVPGLHVTTDGNPSGNVGI